MDTLLIVNPQANRGRCAADLPQIITALKAAQVAFSWVKTTQRGDAICLAQEAARNGVQRVVAVGGDGTCNEVVNGLLTAESAGHQPEFGLIPMGSGNDFAYALGIPNQLSAACQRLAEGQAQPTDIGLVRVDGHQQYFCNSVGLGLDGEVALELENNRQLQGLLMYALAALKVIAFGQWPYGLTLNQADHLETHRLTLLTVANGSRAGGGFHFTPQAKLNDGLLDMCFAAGVSKLEALRLMRLLLQGQHLAHPAVHYQQSPTFSLQASPGIPAHIDGELLTRQGKVFEFWVKAQTLRVWA